MTLSTTDITALLLSVKLAAVTTLLLLVISTPIAWWLSQTHSRWKTSISVLITLPVVLPPSVLGFYLLMFMGPQGWLGQVTQWLDMGSLAFSFTGLVIASVIYSLPFVVQPIYNAMMAIGPKPLEVAATLRASPWDQFISVVLPLTKPGFLTAAVLGFAHTLGEFGIVLMIGGNISGETQVASVRIYEHVEALDYASAHSLSLILVGFAFVALLLVYSLNARATLFASSFAASTAKPSLNEQAP